MTFSTRIDEVKALLNSVGHGNELARRVRLHRLVFRWDDKRAYEENLRTLVEKLVLQARGVNTPCTTCHGLGTLHYSHGSTWRGGMGTASFAHDVCDTCWGSGDAHRHGVNLRDLEAARDAWEDAQAVQYLSRKLGISFTGTKERLEELAKLCEKQARKRSVPGAGEFWYVQGWERLATTLRRLATEKVP